jgi:hypothetical protein
MEDKGKAIPIVVFKSPKMKAGHRQIIRYLFLEGPGGIVVQTPIYQN